MAGRRFCQLRSSAFTAETLTGGMGAEYWAICSRMERYLKPASTATTTATTASMISMRRNIFLFPGMDLSMNRPEFGTIRASQGFRPVLEPIGAPLRGGMSTLVPVKGSSQRSWGYKRLFRRGFSAFCGDRG
ncbi:hypothetical protein D3C80_1575900 [compost metagenome]